MKKLSAILILGILQQGCIYYNVTNPLDTNLDRTVLGPKVGKATATTVMWAVAWGDAGTRAAAENGGITTITHADKEEYGILFGLYNKTTTVVYGE